MQSQPVGICDIVAVLLIIACGFAAILGIVHGDSAFGRCHDGVSASVALVSFARMLLVSLPALRCHCCQHCAGVIALVLWASLPLLHWHCQSWHTRVAASIVLLEIASCASCASIQ